MKASGRASLETRGYWERLIKKGVCRFLLLDALSRGPAHGYELARAIEACCQGWCRPTDGMVYPTLKELVEGGYVECHDEVVQGRRRRVCRLTPRGVAAHRVAAQVWAGLLPYLNTAVAEALEGTAEPAAGRLSEAGPGP